MKKILFNVSEIKCTCKKKVDLTKKQKSNIQTEGKPLQYPNSAEITSKTLRIKYQKKLSSISKLILNSFQNKYLYYAIDDILYTLKLNTTERNDLLEILYSSILSLQNNFYVNFFNIWIHEICISEIPKSNRFLTKTERYTNFESFTYITITLTYKNQLTIKKQKTLW